jgi:hypothetical protein
MAEANDSVQLTKLRASMSLATNTLALQRAIKAAKHQLSAQGLRPSHFSHRELVISAEAYLADHREETGRPFGASATGMFRFSDHPFSQR